MSGLAAVNNLAEEPLKVDETLKSQPQWEALRDPSRGRQFATSGWIALSPFETLLGIEIKSAEAGRSVLTMPFALKLSMCEGLMHGGAISSLADTAIAVAIKTILPSGSHFVTSEMTTRFLAPVREGTLTANARISQYAGKHLITVAEITDCDGVKVACLNASFRVLRHGESK